jgi:hypothetical protein
MLLPLSVTLPRAWRGLLLPSRTSSICGDFGELGWRGFEVFYDFTRQHVGIGEIGAVFQGFVSSQKMSRLTLSRLISSP